MQLSIAPLLFTLILSQRLFNFSKINNHLQWVRLFRYARIFAMFLFVSELILSGSTITKWIWDFFMISLVLFAFQQKEMRPLRMYLLAFAPYALLSLLSDLTELILNDFYKQWINYFENASMLAVIWLIAIIFSQYRQNKAAEKELIKRQKEDEINRAIAIRKVELEGLVAERTAELTMQKEELEKILNKLRTTQTQLIHSEKMAALGELTAGIAHEIQNPLNFVNNFSEVNAELISELEEERNKEIRNNEIEDELLKDLKDNEQKITHHGRRAEAIVKGMLQHSRSSTGKKELTDINALADEYLRLAYHGLRAKDKSFNATIKTNFDENIEKISVIPQDIGRVMLNLITNAFYAVNEKKNEALQSSEEMSYEPTVTVSSSLNTEATGEDGQAILISIADNGNGIPESVLDKVFQPFFTTKPTGKGTGLGLSMSYEIVTKGHGGELKMENKEGEGVTFTIILPV